MDKHLIILFLFLIGASGCSKNWNEEEQKDFINDCMVMGGLDTTCACILSCLEKEYITYNEVLSSIEKKGLKKEYKECLEKCE